MALAFDIPISKDVARRILAAQYQPAPDLDRPVLAHRARSREGQPVESRFVSLRITTLRTHWVLVVMDQFTRS
jgi:hypothetical protein